MVTELFLTNDSKLFLDKIRITGIIRKYKKNAYTWLALLQMLLWKEQYFDIAIFQAIIILKIV